jgi:hypothetical protein
VARPSNAAYFEKHVLIDSPNVIFFSLGKWLGTVQQLQFVAQSGSYEIKRKA